MRHGVMGVSDSLEITMGKMIQIETGVRRTPCLEGEMGADESDIRQGGTSSCWDPGWCGCVAKGVETNDSKRSVTLATAAASSVLECHV